MSPDLPVVDYTGRRPQARPSSGSTLTDLLGEWFDELRSCGFPLDSAVSLGVANDRVQQRLERDGLETSPEIEAWFGWFNGQPLLGGIPSLTPAFYFMDLDWCIERRSYGLPIGLEKGDWRPEWIRLSSDKVCLATSIGADPPRVRVVDDAGWNTWDEEGPTEVLSLCTAVVWFIEALKVGSHLWNKAAQRWERVDDLADPLAALHGYV